MAAEITPRSLCIALVYSFAHVSSATSAGFIGWISPPPYFPHHHRLPLCLPLSPSHGEWETAWTSFRPCLRMLWVGLAKRGQRRVEEPPFGLDQFGLDSYVDPAGSNLYWACRQKPSPDVLFGYLNNEQRRPELDVGLTPKEYWPSRRRIARFRSRKHARSFSVESRRTRLILALHIPRNFRYEICQQEVKKMSRISILVLGVALPVAFAAPLIAQERKPQR